MQSIFYLHSRFRILNVPIGIRVWYRRRVGGMAESEAFWRGVEEAGFKAGNGLVDEVVD